MFDLRLELQRRDVGLSELARDSGLSLATVRRIANGRSAGRPATRRVLRRTLAGYPPVEQEALAR